MMAGLMALHGILDFISLARGQHIFFGFPPGQDEQMRVRPLSLSVFLNLAHSHIFYTIHKKLSLKSTKCTRWSRILHFCRNITFSYSIA
jgi:hypothetical protein